MSANAVPTSVQNTTPLATRWFAPTTGSVWDTVRWEKRAAIIKNSDGETIFEQLDLDFPSSWSQTATQVVASRYFRGHIGEEGRESSVRDLISRVVDTIADWGLADDYFDDRADAEAFRDDLRWLCLHQHVAFNSPVWFNVGAEKEAQCSACFINGVEDTMESILGLAKTEGMLFKHGSGSGANLSTLRGAEEPLSGGGTASGPLAFMRGLDAMAGAIKSGGRTRRAARMVMLDDSHPDLLDFVRCKALEEKKAWALLDAGYDGGFNIQGGAYDSVSFQNANHSVRCSDAFMEAVKSDSDWSQLTVMDGVPTSTAPARSVLREIASAAWLCGDPGVQFSDAVNRAHTCPSAGPIRASNPCGEFVFLDNTACNLASLNLLAFTREDGHFDTARFELAIERVVTAMDILVDRARYPTEQITKNSHAYRPLGLGYSNLGAVLMATGRAYDSDSGRAMAGAITSLMSARGMATSAGLAARKGAFEGWAPDAEVMASVVETHADATKSLQTDPLCDYIQSAANDAWTDALADARKTGFRNAQVSLLAPTGTISFMMDCDTTGVEPELCLVKIRTLAGGGTLKVVNQGVPRALRALGYSATKQAAILGWLEEHGTVEGAPGLAAKDLSVFDCALRAPGATRVIQPRGHLGMMAAVQPYLSGAISKTVNLPPSTTVEEIEELLIESWELGLKSVTVYRDGSKRTQPIQTSAQPKSAPQPGPSTDASPSSDAARLAPAGPIRERLPATRSAITHKFEIGGHDGYLTVGEHADGRPGELFLVMAKEGSVVSGLVNMFATSVSMALQYGVPLEVLCNKFGHTRFEPAGFTGNPDIPFASSITDYVFRWLEMRYLADGEASAPSPLAAEAAASAKATAPRTRKLPENDVVSDAPPCAACGALMVRSGTCHKCMNCGGTSGCS
jgi:ribonucleoside-diphosphate reductase alpha chain